MSLYKKYAAKRSCLVNATTLASYNPLCIRQNLLERIKQIMTIYDNLNEKLQYSFNREAPRKSALSAGKIDKLNTLQAEKNITY